MTTTPARPDEPIDAARSVLDGHTALGIDEELFVNHFDADTGRLHRVHVETGERRHVVDLCEWSGRRSLPSALAAWLDTVREQVGWTEFWPAGAP